MAACKHQFALVPLVISDAVRQETSVSAPGPQRLHLPDEDSEAVERLLEFCYTGTYQDGVSSPPKEELDEVIEDCSSEATVDGAVEDEDNEEYGGDEEQDGEEDEDEMEEDDEMEADGEDDEDMDGAENCEDVEYVDDDEDSDDVSVFEIPDQDGCKALFVHLRVYVLADKHKVEPLRRLARHRFRSEARMIFHTAPEWPDVVDELFSKTRDDDDFMRRVPSLLSSSILFNENDFYNRIRETMRKHGDFSFRVMETLATSPTTRLWWMDEGRHGAANQPR
jgi:hypothetical protein